MIQLANHDSVALSEPPEWGGNSWTTSCLFNKDTNRSELETFTADQSHCNQGCTDWPTCTHYVWTQKPPSAGICALKTGSVHRSNVVKGSKPLPTTCGIKGRPFSQHILFESQTNFLTIASAEGRTWHPLVFVFSLSKCPLIA